MSVGPQRSLRALTRVACREAYEMYLAEGAQIQNRRIERAISDLPNQFAVDLDVCTNEELADDLIYNRFMRPLGLGWSAGSAFSTPSGDILVIDFLRREADGPFDRRALRRFNYAWPHFARGVLLAHRLGLRAAQTTTDALEAVGLPAAVFDQRGQVVSSNVSLEALSPRIRLGAFDRLGFNAPTADKLFAEALSALGQADGQNPSSIPLAATRDHEALIAHILPIRRAGSDVFSRGAGILIVT